MKLNAPINILPNKVIAVVIAFIFNHVPTASATGKKGVDPILGILWFLHLVSFFEPIIPGTYIIVLSVDILKGEVPRANSFFCIKASLDVSPEFSQALI